MRTDWDLMDEARNRQAEWMAVADRARLRTEATPDPAHPSLTLRAAVLLRQAADHLEHQDRLRRLSTR